MSDPVRHHYLPQFYLRPWCGDDGLLVVARNFSGTIKFYRRSPKAVGYEDHLYSASDSLPTPEPAALETRLMSPLDNLGKTLVDKLIANKRPSEEERWLWAGVLAMLLARTPEKIDLIKQTGTHIVEKEFATGQTEYESLREAEDPESFMEWVESRFPGLRENFGLMSLPRVLKFDGVRKIKELVWHTLEFPESCDTLLSSDRPLVLSGGIDDPDSIVAIPLGPRNAFIGFRRGSRAQAALTRQGPPVIAKVLNQSVVGQAKQEAYCLNQSDAPASFYQTHLRDSKVTTADADTL